MGAAFSLDIGDWCKKAKKDVDRAARSIVLTIFSGVIEKTPVDTGAARGNWQLGYDVMPQGTVTVKDTSRGSAAPALAAKMDQPIIGRTLYLVNNLPYIGVLEYGGYPNPPKGGEGKTAGGFSRQAPAGMVRITVSEISERVREGISKGMRRG
jgi:hypothetical protein